MGLSHLMLILLGGAVVIVALQSAMRTFVLPRSASDEVARIVFLTNRKIFDLICRPLRTYYARDRIMAMYAPFCLLALDAVWLGIVLVGFTLLFYGMGIGSWDAALRSSGSALFTLGFANVPGPAPVLLTFVESLFGLTMVALLISYLPTIYAAFSRREAAVTLLEVRAGLPPSALTMIERYYLVQGLHRLHETFIAWEQWFAELEETHTSLAALCFFRSPKPDRSWVTASGTVLDTAALVTAALDMPRDAQVDLCIRAGFMALRHIADFFHMSYDPDPAPDDPISITRKEFDDALHQLAAIGVPLKPDRDQAWRDFAGWRVNYDTVLLALARLTLAPPGALWCTDRARLPVASSAKVTQATQAAQAPGA